jgi:Protein of unknown function (DUF3300)
MKERVGGAHNEEGLFPRSIRAVAVHESSRLCVTRHTSHVTTDYDHSANFSQYKTYSWIKVQAGDSLWADRITTQRQTIVIEPVNPDVVYIPQYDPWLVYGAPLAVWPGWSPYPGLYLAGLGIGFGVGFGLGFFAGFGWGWGHWVFNWHNRTVIYNHTTYISHSRTFVTRHSFNHGFHGVNRAGFHGAAPSGGGRSTTWIRRVAQPGWCALRGVQRLQPWRRHQGELLPWTIELRRRVPRGWGTKVMSLFLLLKDPTKSIYGGKA